MLGTNLSGGRSLAADRPPLCREHRHWFVLSDWRPKKVSTIPILKFTLRTI
jgi:hypothetical protein